MQRPDKNEYDPYYERYIQLVESEDVIDVLERQKTEVSDAFGGLGEDKGTFRYADGKWSIKEMLSHIIDGERMFAYRVFRISRGDKTPIEGFEQDGYIENSHANDRSFSDMLGEFDSLRNANMLFFRNLRDADWMRTGTANEREISVRALGFIMAGHIRHHLNILNERYSSNAFRRPDRRRWSGRALLLIEAGKRGRKVAVLEHNAEVGRKILISGGGRCNFTNVNTSPENFVSQNPHFPKSALARYTPKDFISLVREHKIDFYEKTLGQMFCRESSRQIVDMLLKECRQSRVVIKPNCRVESVERNRDFVLQTSHGRIAVKS